jgi:hypothetical protein
MDPFANEDSWEKFKDTHNLTEEHVLALQDIYKEYSVSVEYENINLARKNKYFDLCWQ